MTSRRAIGAGCDGERGQPQWLRLLHFTDYRTCRAAVRCNFATSAFVRSSYEFWAVVWLIVAPESLARYVLVVPLPTAGYPLIRRHSTPVEVKKIWLWVGGAC